MCKKNSTLRSWKHKVRFAFDVKLLETLKIRFCQTCAFADLETITRQLKATRALSPYVLIKSLFLNFITQFLINTQKLQNGICWNGMRVWFVLLHICNIIDTQRQSGYIFCGVRVYLMVCSVASILCDNTKIFMRILRVKNVGISTFSYFFLNNVAFSFLIN